MVLAFISILLGRRTTSTAAMRVYMLDTAFLPAGASSILALIVMGVEYFATPYVTKDFLKACFPFLLVFHGGWTATNLVLTAGFLLRTMYFISHREQQHVFARVAVDVAYREELRAAAMQHIYVAVPQADWGYPDDSEKEDVRVEVSMVEGYGAKPEVVKDLNGSHVLHEVYTKLLKWVAKRWTKRALAIAEEPDDEAEGARAGTTKRRPALAFPARLAGVASGEVTLCSVRNGPQLTWLERRLVRWAHRYRASAESILSLGTKEMLQELSEEAIASAELQRFGAASDALRDTYKLHRTLLMASTADTEGEFQNVAAMRASPYGIFQGDAFSRAWVGPYVDVGRIAVDKLEDDTRLFRALSYASSTIAHGLAVKPERLLVDAQLPAYWLSKQLEAWWTRKVEEHHALGIPRLPELPIQLRRTYEEALVSFISGWNDFDVAGPSSKSDEEQWRSYRARASIYASHIENTAEHFLNAVFREDRIAAAWYLDNFLKWWGDRQFELEAGHLDGDWRVRHVTIGLVELEWDAAREFLWDGAEPISLKFATLAMNLGTRRYWESMRLYMALLLIERAHVSDDAQVQGWLLDMVASIVRGKELKDGGMVVAESMDTMGLALAEMMWTSFAHPLQQRRMAAFADNWRGLSDKAVVTNRTFSPTQEVLLFSQLKEGKATLLAALSVGRRPHPVDARRVVHRWWRDVERLAEVERYLAELRRTSLSATQRRRRDLIEALRDRLRQGGGSVRQAQLALTGMLKDVQRTASRERVSTLVAINVSTERTRRFACAVSQAAFAEATLPAPITAVHFQTPIEGGRSYTWRHNEAKVQFIEGTGAQPSERIAADIGREFGRWAAASAVAWWLASEGVRPVNRPELRFAFNATAAEKQQFLLDLAATCQAVADSGGRPAILAGSGTASALLNPWRWGASEGQVPFPEGVSIERSEANDSSSSRLNGWPIYGFDTEKGDCYVVDEDEVRTLRVEANGPADALAVKWEPLGKEDIQFKLECRASVGARR